MKKIILLIFEGDSDSFALYDWLYKIVFGIRSSFLSDFPRKPEFSDKIRLILGIHRQNVNI